MELVTIFNAVIRYKYIPARWKIAEIFVLLKPDKPPTQAASYRPISLLPVIGTLFEKLNIKRLNEIVKHKNLMIYASFGFWAQRSTVDQLCRVTKLIEDALKKGEYCMAVFFDVAQAFDRVWHERLVEKLYKMLPRYHVDLLSSFFTLQSSLWKLNFQHKMHKGRGCVGFPRVAH